MAAGRKTDYRIIADKRCRACVVFVLVKEVVLDV